MEKVYDVKNLKVTTESICFELAGKSISVSLSKSGSTVLHNAAPEYLQNFELDNYGIGIHWPLLDEDLSIEGLLRSAGCYNLIVEHKLPNWYEQELLIEVS